MHYCLFPKFFQELSLDGLMELCSNCGLDAPAAFVRDGYWLQLPSLERDLKSFMERAKAHGLTPEFASLDVNGEELHRKPEILKSLADAGIKCARSGFIFTKDAGGVRSLADHCRHNAELAAKAAEAAGIKVVIQIHGWGIYPHNATTAYGAVRGFDPRFIGVMIDPGNNTGEGYEPFGYQFELLGEYVSAIGAKDGCKLRTGDQNATDKGWKHMMAPVYEGENNWHEIFSGLKKLSFNGPAVLMPFYTYLKGSDFRNALKREVEYLRGIEKTV